MATILLALFVGDHPRLFAANRHQLVNLDAAYTDEDQLTARLETLLGAEILKVKVKKVDLVNDTTAVDVRFRRPPAGANRTHQLHDNTITSTSTIARARVGVNR